MPFRNLHPMPASPQLAPANVSSLAPGRFAVVQRNSTIAFPGRRFSPALQRTCRPSATWVSALVRESSLPQHCRILLVLALSSFLAAWAGTRAVMARFEESWTRIPLAAARHENQELRKRQEVLREQTAAALAHLEAVEAMYARTP